MQISIATLVAMLTSTVDEGKSDKDTALTTGINIRTAQHYIKKYNVDEEKSLPIRCSKPAA
jgi:hypothetical protein